MQPTVLVASPNASVRCDLSDLFGQKGYEVVYSARSEQVSTLVKTNWPGLILLSDEMPAVDGIELVSMLRRLTLVPMIVMGNGGSNALIKCVLNGADAYINSPINDAELLLRVRNLLKRARINENLGLTRSDSKSTEQLVSKVENRLTKTEMKLFKCLAERRDRLISSEEVMNNVWGKSVKGERLRFYVHSLRRKLSRHAPFRVHTQKGVGYRLVETDTISKESAGD